MNELETKLKQMIEKNYGNLSQFSKKAKIPYTTVDSMLKRGIKNANVLNVLKLCDALQINVESLKHNIIEPAEVKEITSQEYFIALIEDNIKKADPFAKSQFQQIFIKLINHSNFNKQQKDYLINTVNFICEKE